MQFFALAIAIGLLQARSAIVELTPPSARSMLVIPPGTMK